MLTWIARALVLAIAVGGAVASEDTRDCCGPCVCGTNEQLNLIWATERLAEVSDELFLGKVVGLETVQCCKTLKDVTFRVEKRWKGSGGELVTVRFGGGCRKLFQFSTGAEYLVSAIRVNEDRHLLVEDSRFRPMELNLAREHVAALDQWARTRGDPSSHD